MISCSWTGRESWRSALPSGNLRSVPPPHWKGRYLMKRAHLWIVATVCFGGGLGVGLLWTQASLPSLVPPVAAVEAAAQAAARPPMPPEDGKLRIICFGAHPDDCELKAAGAAALWAAKGHHVKFVSVTNGDIGHWRDAGGPLARRRTSEVQQVARVLGITTEVLDIHDGELLPTLENRRTITRLIREWKANIVMNHRPNDY